MARAYLGRSFLPLAHARHAKLLGPLSRAAAAAGADRRRRGRSGLSANQRPVRLARRIAHPPRAARFCRLLQWLRLALAVQLFRRLSVAAGRKRSAAEPRMARAGAGA